MVHNITVRNKSATTVYCFMTTYTHSGNDNWYKIEPGNSEVWYRNGWDFVAFKNDADDKRAGVYLNMKHDMTIDFMSFDEIIHD